MTSGGLVAALRQWAMPVVVASACSGDRISCATSTAMYVALDPLVLAISLRPDSTTCALVLDSREVALSMLTADQVPVAQLAARPTVAADKFADLGIARQAPPSGHNAPGVADAAVVLWCTVVDDRRIGDHVEILARAESFHLGDTAAPPLLRHRRRYVGTGRAVSAEEKGGYPL